MFGDRVADAMLFEGGYVHSESDANWWVPSGRSFLSPNAGDTPEQELAFARQHFFVPQRLQDPFGNVATVSYDVQDLLPIATRDPLDNTVQVVNDYRVLQPRLVTDPNGNRSEAAFDTLGMVVGTAVMGKPNEGLGDSLQGFEADLDDDTIASHLQAPLVDPHSLLQGATTRLVYDLFAYQRTRADAQPQPAVVYTLARETHLSDLGPDESTRVQHSFAYSDGFGREIQKKIQAEPGPVEIDGATDRPALGRQRLDRLQQQGQAGAAVRALLQRHARASSSIGSKASAPSCSTTRSSASSPRCIPIRPGRRWSSIRGGRRPGMSTTPR